MPLFNKTNNYGRCSEEEMQDALIEHIKNTTWFHTVGQWNLDEMKVHVFKEMTIPTLGRRSDIIVYFSSRKIFNIECKLTDSRGVLKQAIDHLSWANYSMVCMPHEAYIPNDVKASMIEKNIGLILYDEKTGCFMEAIYPMRSKGKINKKIRTKVQEKIHNELDVLEFDYD